MITRLLQRNLKDIRNKISSSISDLEKLDRKQDLTLLRQDLADLRRDLSQVPSLHESEFQKHLESFDKVLERELALNKEDRQVRSSLFRLQDRVGLVLRKIRRIGR